MRGVLIDLDGVVYQGDTLIAGATDSIAWLQNTGLAHLFLTNTTSRPREALVAKLAKLGIKTGTEEIITPALVARTWLQHEGCKAIALFVPEATRNDFAGLCVLDDEAQSGADAVVIGDLGDRWTFAELNRAFRLLESSPGAALVALGMTRYWRSTAGLQLDTGPFVTALEFAVGRKAVVAGKPSPAFFATALDQLGLKASDTVMIGDDIRGDVEAAQACGLKALLVRTGKFTPLDLEGDIVPDAVLDSIADFQNWWEG